MSDINYGGTDEESAEIKKLNAEVVSQSPIVSRPEHTLTISAHSSKIPTTLKTGRSLFAPRKVSKAA